MINKQSFKLKSLITTPIALGAMAALALPKSSQTNFANQYAVNAKRTPSFGAIKPYYKLAKISEYKRSKNMDILKKVGLTKVASNENPMDLFFKGIEKIGADSSVGVVILSEIDSDVALDKLAADLEIGHDTEDYYNLPIVIANDYTKGALDKTAAANDKLDKNVLARKTIEKLMPLGEISKIASATLINLGAAEGDDFDKIASNVSEGDLNVTKVAMELASEGYSPELLKEAADAEKIEFVKMASEILEGETNAIEKIMNAEASSDYVEKTASDEKLSDSYKAGVESAIIKMAGYIHPKGIAKLVGEKFEKTASKTGKIADLEAHKYACEGAGVLGYRPEAVQSIYSYINKDYALDKHASILPEDFVKEAQLAFDTLVKVAVVNRKLTKKAEQNEGYTEAVNAFANTIKEDINKVASRMYVAEGFLSGANPIEFVTEDMDKTALAVLKLNLNAEQHSKVI